MKKTLIASAIALLGFTSSAIADDHMKPHFGFAKVGYVELDIDDMQGFDLDGFNGELSMDIGQGVFWDFAFTQVDAELEIAGETIEGIKLDVSRIDVGIGYHTQVHEMVDLYGKLGWNKWKFKALTESTTDNPFTAEVGARGVLVEGLEYHAAVGYIDFEEDSETTYTLGLSYNFTKSFAFGVEYEDFGQADMTSAYLRMNF